MTAPGRASTAKALLAFALAASAGAVEAQGRAGVFVDAPRTEPLRTTATAPADHDDGRLVTIDHSALAAARADAAGGGVGRLTLNIDDGVVLEALVERSAPTVTGYALSGRIASTSASALTWVVNGELVMGTVWTPAAVYDIVPAASDGVHVIRQVDQFAARPLGEPLKGPPDAYFDPHIAEARKDDGSVVDVLVLWTPTVRFAAGGEDRIRTAIDHYVATTNDALRRSGTTLQIDLVGQQEVIYAEANESEEDLKRLQKPDDGYMDEVHARRDALGADLVSLITGNADIGGIAFRMNDLHVGFGEKAFSVVTYSNALYFAATAFAHELGHNMSLAHDRFVTPDGALYEFGHGYVNANAFEPGAAHDTCWRTIMAYGAHCFENGLNSRTVPYFSTPRLRYPDREGEPLGTPKTHDVEGRKGPADAVLALEQVRHVVANFRSEHTDDGDTLAAATPIAASSGTFAELLDGGGDVDFFRIELTEAGSLRVATTGMTDTLGALLNDNGSVLTQDDDGGASHNFLIEHALDAGVYFIRVEGSRNSGGVYGLLTTFHAASDADDHGDAPAAATTIAATASADVSLEDAGDVDVFRIDLPARGVLEATTRGSVDTVGTLRREGDKIRFAFHQEQSLTPRQGGVYAGGGIAETYAISDDDGGLGGNFKIAAKLDAGVYHLAVRGWNDAQGATTLELSFDSSADDHGDSTASATAIPLPALIAGELEAPLDKDTFRINVAQPGILRLQTTGDETDTWGTLTDADGGQRTVNDDEEGNWPNFGIAKEVDPGVYFLEVRGWYFTQGPYLLVASLDRGIASIPLFIAHGHASQQGFVRIINRAHEGGTVTIHAIDDEGTRSDPLRLAIGAGQTRHLNSKDLEQGNPSKGLEGRTGDGAGNWRLEVEADMAVEVLAYVRTRDGFLTSMHDVVPAAPHDPGRYRVVTFNPASNRDQVSRLRLVNPGPEAVEVDIRGIDDDGAEAPGGEVTLTLPPGRARAISAQELEAGADGMEGALGNGAGRWQLLVDADGPIVAMSLLESRNGQLTNLSAPTSRSSIPLFLRAAHPTQQGFLRVMNRSDEAGAVTIRAFDDFGNRRAPVTLAIDANAVRHINSDDLETGAPDKGLIGRTGPLGAGSWRLELTSLLEVEAYSYVRTTDGFLTSMHDLAPTTDGGQAIVIFNPASNERQASRLRLVNPGAEDAEVTISAVDDDGEAGEEEVTLALPSGRSVELTARQLEAGDDGFAGRLGDGTGKWRLTIDAEQTIHAMSLLEARTGNLTNLSTRVGGGS